MKKSATSARLFLTSVWGERALSDTPPTLGGVFAAVLTPLDAALAPDHAALARHCRWLLANGCDGLAVLGTTGEAN
ncbi:MAG: dihydrodipicolinate synthase family protein, partial [Rhodospirillales bacterium]